MKEAWLLLAQAGPNGGGGDGLMSMLLFMGAMFLLLYALMIRPQSRQRKKREQMLSELKKGDQVVTGGGLHGRITGMSDDVITLEIADRVRVRVDKSALTSRAASAKEEKKS